MLDPCLAKHWHCMTYTLAQTLAHVWLGWHCLAKPERPQALPLTHTVTHTVTHTLSVCLTHTHTLPPSSASPPKTSSQNTSTQSATTAARRTSAASSTASATQPRSTSSCLTTRTASRAPPSQLTNSLARKLSLWGPSSGLRRRSSAFSAVASRLVPRRTRRTSAYSRP